MPYLTKTATLYCFIFSLTATSLFAQDEGIFLGPSLYAPTPTSVNVWWHIKHDEKEHQVLFGTNRKKLDQEVSLQETTGYPHVELTGLEAGMTYYYQVKSGSAESEIYSFNLPDPDKPFRMVFWSDNQNGFEVFGNKTVPLMMEQKPDLLLTAGDLVSDGAEYEHWDKHLYGPAKELFSSVPWYPVRGNHDYDPDSDLCYKMLPLPETNHYYAKSYGPLRILIIDSNEDTEEQWAWLEEQLQNEAWKNAKFRMVAFHHPAFNSLWDSPSIDGRALYRSTLVPMLEDAYGDIVINGHMHAYERLRRLMGNDEFIEYVIIGGAGGTLDTVPVYQWPFSVVKYSTHHILVADIDEEKMMLKMIELDTEKILDTFMIPANKPDEEKATGKTE